jgi:FkbH-like protein
MVNAEGGYHGGSAMAEKIKLVVWDLDDTFWHGTLTEGGHTYDRTHHGIVVSLAERGIISTICSKNDLAPVQAVLEAEGSWDYFVFPSVNWEPKGPRIAALIEDMQLRPCNVLFVDDNPINRNEALHYLPDIQVADETIIPTLLDSPLLKGKDDRALTRLNQYKLLQRRKADESKSGGDNISFLRSAQIKLVVEPDVEGHIDRAVELINRTNQLNFTKQRLPEDIPAARDALRAHLNRHFVQAGLVRVEDKYGDHGYVGFFLAEGFGPATRLVHFCFSCRILNMGVEAWLYHHLGQPKLRTVGDVLTPIGADTPCPDWINVAPSALDGAATETIRVSKVIAHGGCNIAALSHYFAVTGAEVVGESNVARNGLDTLVNHSVFLRYAMDGISEEQAQELLRMGYLPADWSTALLEPQPAEPVWLLSFLADADVMLYRHRTLDVTIPFNVIYPGKPPNLLDVETSEVPSTIATPWLIAALEHLKANYELVGRTSEAAFSDTLCRLLERAPKDARVFILLNNEVRWDEGGTSHAMPWKSRCNAWTRSVVARFPNAEVLDMAAFSGDSRGDPRDPNHFDRLVYYKIFRHITDRLRTWDSNRVAPSNNANKASKPMSTAMPSPHVTTIETGTSTHLSFALRSAFDMAMEERSALLPPLFQVRGFSGRKFRMFLQNLFGIVPDPRYLEVGVFCGGSFIPAIYKNTMSATALDNWSWDGSNLDLFKSYLKQFGGEAKVNIIESDFRAVDYAGIGRFNVMFYDGSHTEADQFDGVRLPAAAMEDTYIVIVDDWNWDQVRRGTFRGLRAAGCRVDYSIEVRIKLDVPGDNLPSVRGPISEWHNGMFAAVVTKAK